MNDIEGSRRTREHSISLYSGGITPYLMEDITMNALVSVRSLGGENQAVSSSVRARNARELSAQQTASAQSSFQDALAELKAAAASLASKKAAASSSAKSAASSSEVASAAKSSDTSSDSSTSRVVSNTLDQDAFLQLLVFQLQNQDPLSPTDNTQMIAQLAQFSSLEQMNNLNTSFETVSSDIDRLNFVSASALVGRTVSGTDTNGAAVEGTVDRVYMDASSGTTYLLVGTTPVALSNLTQISSSAA